MFDEGALACVEAIGELRSLGLTLTEIEQLNDRYLNCPDQPIGPHLARLLDRSHQRIIARIQAQQQTLARITAYRRQNHDVLGEASRGQAARGP